MQRDRQARQARWAVAAMFLANGFVMGAWAPQIPLLMPRHGVTESVLGLLILVLGLGAVSAMLFAGRLISHYGGRRILSLFSLALIPVLPMVVFSPNLWVLALFMAFFGAMAGSMDVAMNAQAVEIERRLDRAIMSSSHGFWSLGGFIGGSAGSWVIAQWGSEVQSIATAVVVAGVVLAAMPFLLADAPGPAVAEASAVPKTRLFPKDLHVWLLGFLALFAMVPEGAVLDWAAIYLQKELGADVFVSGLGFAFFAGAMAVMRFAGDSVRNRFGAVRTLRLSGFLGAAGLMGGALAPQDWVAIVSFTIAGLGVANMVPILFSAAGNHPHLPPANAISIVTMVGYCGILIAPSTIGFLAEQMGFRPTYGGLSLLLVVVALVAARASDADGAKPVEPLGATIA
ncbi:MFS transporter [Tabrizicola sp.]|jgi:MFS family permease|uniref:MFS transporter n=1 Tax=Tabrizicola sp. TaxID=2005166 RepID=UPI0025F8E0A4|nr:MFS transporter [Tabrizicola sp.]MBY0351613.1 MFS transporter [Tabrizicola sp.]MDK2774779.1 MFS transporter [Tabrizicola sp.]